jgi:hypothetical protein
MRKKSALKQKLCACFCCYYKPGKNEELLCRGYDVVQRLLCRNKKVSFNSSGTRRDPALFEALVQELCVLCPFFAQDCDFMQDRSATPCGGFVLLAQNLESGAIMLADITTERHTKEGKHGLLD